MSKRITIQVPLAGALFGGFTMDEMFTAPPPCFYCGAQVDTRSEHHYTQKGQYQIKYWGRGRKFGSPMLGDIVDSKGNKLMGKYTIKLPYCPEHVAPFKAFKVIDIIALISGIGGGLALTGLLYLKEGLEGGEFLLLLFGLPFFLISLFFTLGLGIKAIIAKINPKLKDYSKTSGHYGVVITGVKTSGGAAMVGPITYTLTLEVTNPQSARRFLQANPLAKVTKGQELLAQSV